MSAMNIYPEKLFPHFRSEICLFSPHTRHVGKGWICGRHVHHTMVELMLVLKGSQTAILGGTEFEQHAGDLIIVSPMQVHDFQTRQSEGAVFFTMHIHPEEPEFLQLIGAHNEGYYPAGHPLNEQIVPGMHRLMEILFRKPEAKIRLLRELYTILGHLQDHYLELVNSTSAPVPFELPARIAKEIQSMVLKREEAGETVLEKFGEPAGDWLEDISRRLGLSRRHCHRIFRQAFGMPPREYMMVLKQQEAMYMLVTSNDSIETIAYRIGYENVQSFSRQFTAWTGCTPSMYRKNHADQCYHLTPMDAV